MPAFLFEETKRGLQAVNVVKLSGKKGYHESHPEHTKETPIKVYKDGLFHERHRYIHQKKSGQ